MLGPLTHVSFGQSGDVVPLTDVEPANALVGSMTIPCGGGVFVAVGVGVVVGVGVFVGVGVTVGVLVAATAITGAVAALACIGIARGGISAVRIVVARSTIAAPVGAVAATAVTGAVAALACIGIARGGISAVRIVVARSAIAAPVGAVAATGGVATLTAKTTIEIQIATTVVWSAVQRTTTQLASLTVAETAATIGVARAAVTVRS